MAKCKYCGKDMLHAKGCACIPIVHNGKEYQPIKVGDPGDWYEGKKDAICGDCGAHYGHYHHPGCDIERCPVCGHQLISCDCDENSVEV